jgi:hypothetical protein
MDLLLSSTEPDWEPWILAALIPVAEAFGFRVIRVKGSVGTQAFNAKLGRLLERCEAAISVHPANPKPPGDWPLRVLAALEARNSPRALLLRRAGQVPDYPTEQDVEYDTADPLTCILKIAAVLGEWYQSPYKFFSANVEF